jgi:serine/threonine protein kinase
MIAVKWIPDRGGYGREGFVREVEHLIKVRHPCVVGFLGWSRGDSGTFEIQMELAANGSLSNYLRVCWNPTAKAVLVCGIVLGMRYVHSRGILHRDLNPSNIFVDEDWHALIGDFSRSKSGSAKGLPTPYVGTWAYAAPEQLDIDVEYDDKVDVYSFGLVLYAVLSGCPAFREGMSRILPDVPMGWGPVMEKLIPRCCAAEPSARPSFRDIFDEFAACQFNILPDVDSKVIRDYVERVLYVEEHGTA